MENPDQDDVVLHAFTSSLSNSRSPEPEQEKKPECKKEEKTRERPPTFLTLTQLEFRIQQLNNRRLLLLEIQRCKKKDEQTNEETIRTEHEDSAEGNEELKNIQMELKELQLKKEELEKRGASYRENTNGGGQEQSTSYNETPPGGIYMLPPLQQNQDDAADPQNPPIPIVPAEVLGLAPELTECPFCNEIVVTETHSTKGNSMWVMCFVCTLMGCVAGCCLIPFFMKNLRNVVHTCPQCQSNIHTHHPV